MSAVRSVAERLRAAADIIETLPPEVPAPSVTVYGFADSISVDWHLIGDDQRQQAASIRRALAGEWSKTGSGDNFWLSRTADDVKMTIFCDREQVCRRVVTGTETRTVPAVEAAPERVEVVETVVWECDPITADEAVSA